MTTAHRPTWKSAVGRASEGGWTSGGAVSSRISTLDVASHTKLKTRQGSQVVDKNAALQESLRKLQEAEAKAPQITKRRLNPAIEEEGRMKLLKQTVEVDEEGIKSKYDDADDQGKGDSDGFFSDLDDDDDDSDLDSDQQDSDDEEAALQAELAKIRAEREAAKKEQQENEAKQEEAHLEEAALIGNPLLQSSQPTSGKMKRRWNDDIVFRNQAKGEPKVKKRFINDTVRNDFHKRFLNKFFR
mmetsp:Transcript_40173/g.56582  ORF Transcript_40173/g.56582 Transcript_40173/m.56582 type:complete len:243 (-) Transcript_40173:1197-1925(-)